MKFDILAARLVNKEISIMFDDGKTGLVSLKDLNILDISNHHPVTVTYNDDIVVIVFTDDSTEIIPWDLLRHYVVGDAGLENN